MDWVERSGMIEDMFERDSEVSDPLVANVDRMVVAFAMDRPRLEPFLLTRFLVEAESAGIPLMLVLNKAELVGEEIRQMLSASEVKCAFNDCLHTGKPGCVVKADWERYPYYFQLLDEIKIREEFQLRTFGTKRESDVRYKVGEMGVKQAEPRLEVKKHRKVSRKRINQSILDDLDEDEWSEVEEGSR